MPYPLLAEAFPDAEVDYPDSDGEPMAESDIQRDYLTYAVESLKAHFAAREDVYVSGNLLIYYEEGNPRATVAPDCFVVFGVPNHRRRTYKLWLEGQVAPAFALEITSLSTRGEDLGAKKGLYSYLGVREYWQYDPSGEFLKPRLRGLTLVDGDYREIRRASPFGADFSLPSEVLSLELHLRAGELRFRDPATGRFLLSYDELQTAQREAEAARQEAELARGAADAARLAAEQQAREEARKREQLEARLAELEARLSGG
jgi:Uma2 family endonuclease